jgi:adenylyltransferase/sulfurtransferase
LSDVLKGSFVFSSTGRFAMSTHQSFPLEATPGEVKTLLDGNAEFLLLDCREAEEYAKACIPQATLLPMSELANRLGELEAFRNKRIVVHCHHGGRSLRVANWLRQQSFAGAQSMTGGIDQWAVEIDPTLPRY